MRSCRSCSPNASSTSPDDEACSGSRPAMRVTFEPEPRPAEALEEQGLVLLEDRQLRVLADARLHPLHRGHREPGAAAARGTSGSRAPRGACRSGRADHRRARAGRRRSARRRSGAPLEAGRPARRPISAAVCTVRVGVKVSSTRTMPIGDRVARGRSSPCSHPEHRLPFDGNARAPGMPNGGAWQAPRPMDVEGDTMTSSNLIAPTRRRSRPRSCSSRLQPHPSRCSPRPTSCRRPRSRRRSSTYTPTHAAPRGRRRAAAGDAVRLSAVPLEHPAASDQEPEAGRPRDDRAVVAGVRSARCRRDRVRPDAAAHRRAAGRADDGAGPPARLVGSSAREPAHRAVAGQRRRALHPPARPASGPSRPELHRRRPRRHERQRRVQVHDDQAGRLPVEEPRERVAAGAHPLLGVRHELHAAHRDADVLPGRPAVRRSIRSTTPSAVRPTATG